MHATTILFPAGVRLSTWLVAAAFVGLAIYRRDWRLILAAWAWMTSWEAIFQAVSIGFDRLPVGIDGPIFYIILAVATVPVLIRYEIRADWLFIGATVGVFAVWVATGFHVDGHSMIGFNVSAELLNEAAKTLWALAFLVPLLRLDLGPGVVTDARDAAEAELERPAREVGLPGSVC